MTFLPHHALGATAFRATRLGIGDLADRAIPIDTLVATLHRALDRGLNVIDTAPNYENGYSEQVVGKALHGRRDDVFVVTKVDHLREPVGPQVAQSLARLHLPFVDLLAFHAVSTLADLDALLAPGGGFDHLAEQVRHGHARFHGLSSHHPDVLLRAIDSGACHVVMFPIGPFVDRRYETEVLPRARERRVGTICFKTFGAGKLLGDTEGYQKPLAGRPGGAAATLPRLSVEECVRYTLTVDPDVALLGLSTPAEQDEAFAAAKAFRPFSPTEMAAVRERAAAAIAGKGDVWWNPK